MQLPFVTNNGNSIDDLINQNAAVAEALCNLDTAMVAASPHGRNYASDEDYEKAAEEFRIKMGWVRSMLKDCHVLAEHLYDIQELRRVKWLSK